MVFYTILFLFGRHYVIERVPPNYTITTYFIILILLTINTLKSSYKQEPYPLYNYCANDNTTTLLTPNIVLFSVFVCAKILDSSFINIPMH